MSETLTPPSPKTVRVTVPVSPEVLEAFKTLGKVSNMSTGKAMGEWLADTVEGAQFMAETMLKARAAPKIVAKELHAYALGLADETGVLMQRVRDIGKQSKKPMGGADGGISGAATAAAPIGAGLVAGGPPSCNTGGKVTKNPTKPKRGE